MRFHQRGIFWLFFGMSWIPTLLAIFFWIRSLGTEYKVSRISAVGEWSNQMHSNVAPGEILRASYAGYTPVYRYARESLSIQGGSISFHYESRIDDLSHATARLNFENQFGGSIVPIFRPDSRIDFESRPAPLRSPGYYMYIPRWDFEYIGHDSLKTPGHSDTLFEFVIPGWSLVLISALFPLRPIFVLGREKHRQFYGRCIYCGYDRRAAISDVCSECGKSDRKFKAGQL